MDRTRKIIKRPIKIGGSVGFIVGSWLDLKKDYEISIKESGYIHEG